MSLQEQWRAVPNHFGYEVSDRGRVRTIDRQVPLGLGRGTRLQRGRVLRPHLDAKRNRNYVGLWRDGSCESRPVYVLVLEAFIGPRPPGMDACHNDGDSTNDRLGNLRWDTKSSNLFDSVGHGTHRNARKSHCIRGHRLVSPNLVLARIQYGHRVCMACARAADAKRKAKRRGESLDVAAFADEAYALIVGYRSTYPKEIHP